MPVPAFARRLFANEGAGPKLRGDIMPVSYGTCSTAAATAAKVVSIPGFVLATGSEVTVRFSIANTANNPTLNINGTGAKPIQYRNAAIAAGYLAANRTYRFVYDGSSYELVGDVDTNTTYTAATAAPKAPASSAAVGTSAKYAREDHVHPLQTSVSGNSGSATKLANARTILVDLASTDAETFDGTANITPGVSGTLPAARGGTGRTDGKVASLAPSAPSTACSSTVAPISIIMARAPQPQARRPRRWLSRVSCWPLARKSPSNFRPRTRQPTRR